MPFLQRQLLHVLLCGVIQPYPIGASWFRALGTVARLSPNILDVLERACSIVVVVLQKSSRMHVVNFTDVVFKPAGVGTRNIFERKKDELPNNELRTISV
jgi:hypothetical protein